eukprot:scaffold1525_cov142-Cylindrotheca_fusiformis.AAC.9
MVESSSTSKIRQRSKNTADKNDASVTTSQKCIAIVGAGFAGLALANYLQKQERIQYVLLEAKERPIPIVGSFRLPSTQVLLELGISIPRRTRKDEDDSTITIPRQELMALLCQRVHVRYSSSVQSVRSVLNASTSDTSENTKQYYITLSNNKKDELGPFDAVVAANGLDVSTNTPWKQHCTAIIGDSFFGRSDILFGLTTRIQKGGAMAMMDGLELGKVLVLDGHQGTNQHDGVHVWQREKARARTAQLASTAAFVALLFVFLLIVVLSVCA